MAYCTNCGKETSAKKVCEHCGVKKNKKHNFCEWCGTAFEPNMKACPNCKEPKRIGSIIGNLFRVLFGAIIIFIGFVYTTSSFKSFPEGFLPGLIVLLIGVAILPFSQRILHKVTHNNLQYRKIIKWVAPPVLAIILFFSMNSWTTTNGYSEALEHWENKAYAAAMNYFVKHPEYKDSKEYIEKFENDVLTSLVQTPWCSDMEFCVDDMGLAISEFRTRWDLCFDEAGSVLRRAQIWEATSATTYRMVAYEDTTFSSYSFVYDTNDETGVYEVRVQFGDKFEYVLDLGIREDGVIVVNGFLGDMQVYKQKLNGEMIPNSGKFVEQYFSRDTSLPELD